MIALVLFVLNLLAALVIFVSGLFFSVNRMTRCTPLRVRLTWICLTAGAFGVLIGPVFGTRQPNLAETLILIGMAAFVLYERRNRDDWCLWRPN